MILLEVGKYVSISGRFGYACTFNAASIFVICMFSMGYIDTSALYHIIRAQSVIKLYVIYNMLEVGDL